MVMSDPDGLIWMIQQEYGWYIAAYLFFSGLAGGAYLTGTAANLLGQRSDGTASGQSMHIITQWGLIFTVVGIAAGMFFLLFFHLGAPFRALLFPILFVNFGSWLVIGTWLIVLFTLIVTLQVLWTLWGSEPVGKSAFPRKITEYVERRSGIPIDTLLTRLANWIKPNRAGQLATTAIGSILAIATIAYTGLKLGYVSSTFPLWDGTLLPLLFVASALSIGIAATMGATVLFDGLQETKVTSFSVADDTIILAEAVVLALLLVTLASGGPGAEVAFSLLTEEYGIMFWGGVVTIGLVLPLILSVVLILVEKNADIQANCRLEKFLRGAYTVKFTFVVLGGAALRYLIIAAAYNAPLAT